MAEEFGVCDVVCEQSACGARGLGEVAARCIAQRCVFDQLRPHASDLPRCRANLSRRSDAERPGQLLGAVRGAERMQRDHQL